MRLYMRGPPGDAGQDAILPLRPRRRSESVRPQIAIDLNGLGTHQAANDFLKIPEDVAPKARPAYWARNALPVMATVWHLYELQILGEIMKPVENADNMMQSYFVEPAKKFVLPVLEEIGMQPDPHIKKCWVLRFRYCPSPRQNTRPSGIGRFCASKSNLGRCDRR